MMHVYLHRAGSIGAATLVAKERSDLWVLRVDFTDGRARVDTICVPHASRMSAEASLGMYDKALRKQRWERIFSAQDQQIDDGRKLIELLAKAWDDRFAATGHRHPVPALHAVLEAIAEEVGFPLSVATPARTRPRVPLHPVASSHAQVAVAP